MVGDGMLQKVVLYFDCFQFQTFYRPCHGTTGELQFLCLNGVFQCSYNMCVIHESVTQFALVVLHINLF